MSRSIYNRTVGLVFLGRSVLFDPLAYMHKVLFFRCLFVLGFAFLALRWRGLVDATKMWLDASKIDI